MSRVNVGSHSRIQRPLPPDFGLYNEDSALYHSLAGDDQVKARCTPKSHNGGTILIQRSALLGKHPSWRIRALLQQTLGI